MIGEIYRFVKVTFDPNISLFVCEAIYPARESRLTGAGTAEKTYTLAGCVCLFLFGVLSLAPSAAMPRRVPMVPWLIVFGLFGGRKGFPN